MFICILICWSISQVALVVKNPPANARDIKDVGLIPGSGRSPGGGLGNPFQHSCLENPMDGGDWQATVHKVTKGRTPTWSSKHFLCGGKGISNEWEGRWEDRSCGKHDDLHWTAPPGFHTLWFCPWPCDFLVNETSASMMTAETWEALTQWDLSSCGSHLPWCKKPWTGGQSRLLTGKWPHEEEPGGWEPVGGSAPAGLPAGWSLLTDSRQSQQRNDPGELSRIAESHANKGIGLKPSDFGVDCYAVIDSENGGKTEKLPQSLGRQYCSVIKSIGSERGLSGF